MLRPQRVSEAAAVIESTVYPLLLIVSSADVCAQQGLTCKHSGIHLVTFDSGSLRSEARHNKRDKKSTRLLVYQAASKVRAPGNQATLLDKMKYQYLCPLHLHTLNKPLVRIGNAITSSPGPGNSIAFALHAAGLLTGPLAPRLSF